MTFNKNIERDQSTIIDFHTIEDLLLEIGNILRHLRQETIGKLICM